MTLPWKCQRTTSEQVPRQPLPKYQVAKGMQREFGHAMAEYLQHNVSRGPDANPRITDMHAFLEHYRHSPGRSRGKLDSLKAALPESCPGGPSLENYRHRTSMALRQLFVRSSLLAVAVPGHPHASLPPSVAGYPTINLPVGHLRDGSPVGLTLYGPPRHETILLQLAQAITKYSLNSRKPPQFRGF